jgi:nitrogen fixation/metabolism regulation signal transduction histidine kinase
MKLKISYILLILFIAVFYIYLSLQLLPEKKIQFLLSELLIVLILFCAFRLYRRFFGPLNLINAGIQAIREQDFNTQFVELEQPEMNTLIKVYNEMLKRLRMERLEKQEKSMLLEQLIDASPSGIIVLDFENRIDVLNPAARALITQDSEDLSGYALCSLKNPLAQALSHLKNDESRVITLNGIRKFKCQKSYFIDRGFQRHFILIEELSEEIAQTEKNAYGKVIRMMSHEVNNSIGAINSILETIRHQWTSSPTPNLETYFQNALDVAIQRNDNLNRFMANFADVIRLPQPVKKEIDLHALLEQIFTLHSVELQQKKIEWIWQLAQDQMLIQADIHQMEQVLVNIIKNAIEALAEKGSIQIVSQLKPTPILIIRNNGKRIPSAIQSQLFSPFVSTKKNGQGIGLTLIREILLNHGFRFSLATNEEGWTEFQIYF